MRRVASLRSTLLYPLLWLWLVPALIATLAAFWLAGQAAESSFDRILKDDALALAAQVHWEEGEPRFKVDSATAASLVFDSLSPSRFIVQTESGKILVGNAELALPPNLASVTLEKDEPLFFDTTTSWGILRTVALRREHAGNPEAVWVIVGEARTKRDQISQQLAAAIFLPAALLGFVIIPFIFLGVRHGLAPAREISEAVAQRSIDDLSPLPLDHVPEELQGLIARLNDLLRRLAEAIAHERRFIAEAAHQLRTPTAGIKLLAEDLVRTHHHAPAAPPDTEVLEELQAAASRSSHLVQQLLALARADCPPSAVEFSDVELVALLKATVLRWEKAAIGAHKSMALSQALRESPPQWSRINPTLLEEALGNVIENAILYGGAEIQVDLEVTESAVCLHLLDNGPPLDPETLANMFSPFWRKQTAEVKKGSGLGLAIAQKVMRNLGGDLSAQSDASISGTRFTFCLPQSLPGH